MYKWIVKLPDPEGGETTATISLNVKDPVNDEATIEIEPLRLKEYVLLELGDWAGYYYGYHAQPYRVEDLTTAVDLQIGIQSGFGDRLISIAYEMPQMDPPNDGLVF